MAVRNTGRSNDLRVPHGARARRAHAFPGTLRRHFTDRRLCGLRPCRRTEDGACRMLGALKKTLRGGDQTQSAGRASARIVAQMAKLFAIDAQARDENMDHAARHTLRMERAPSVLAELKAQIEAASRTALPSSPLGKASSYTLRLWDKLTRFLDYAELELSKAMVSYCTSFVDLSWAGNV